jgi:sialic acid synthase SpsE
LEIKIKDNIIGDNNPVFIIGEMAWSHDGSVENAKKIIKAIYEAGGDAISMHLTSMPDYMTKDYMSKSGKTISGDKNKINVYEYLSEINLSEEEWEELFSYAEELGLITCSQCNDSTSLNFSRKLNPDVHVIAASCFIEEIFVKEISKTMKPIILRIGGATLGEIKRTISLIKESGNNHIILLHGIQTYPTNIEDTNIRSIPTLKQMFSLPTGIADHTDAELDFAFIVPLLAIALGANVVEKHITYDRSKKGEDFESALNPDGFKKLVKHIRLTEKVLGDYSIKSLSDAEIKYRDVSRKKTVAKVDIKKNQIIKESMLTFKRADDGINPTKIKYVLGHKAKCNIKKDQGITLDKIL